MKVWVLEKEYGYYKNLIGYRSFCNLEGMDYKIYSSKNEANSEMKRIAAREIHLNFELLPEDISELLFGIIDERGVYALEDGTIRDVFREKERDSIMPAFVFEKNRFMIPLEEKGESDEFYYLTIKVLEKDVE